MFCCNKGGDELCDACRIAAVIHSVAENHLFVRHVIDAGHIVENRSGNRDLELCGGFSVICGEDSCAC